MDELKKETMAIMMNMQRDAWRERQPIPPIPEDETIPMYDIADIYDHPAEHMTIRGIFRYAGVGVIS